MVLSEMKGGAGLLPWCCNSQVILASSPDPLVHPFVRRRVLWETFAHEPRCARGPSGEFVCYFSYNPQYNRRYGAPCKGANGSTDASCRCD
eukprot:gene15649-3551_t